MEIALAQAGRGTTQMQVQTFEKSAFGAFRPFPCFSAKVPLLNDQQTLSAAARTAIACDRPSGIVRSVLAGDARQILGQIVGDREPRRLVR